MLVSYQHLKVYSLPLPSTYFRFAVSLLLLLLLMLFFPFPFLPPWLASPVEGEEEMKITLLQRKRKQLSGYSKLVIYGVLDLSAATNVFKHYNKVEMRALRDSFTSLTYYIYIINTHIHIH